MNICSLRWATPANRCQKKAEEATPSIKRNGKSPTRSKTRVSSQPSALLFGWGGTDSSRG